MLSPGIHFSTPKIIDEIFFMFSCTHGRSSLAPCSLPTCAANVTLQTSFGRLDVRFKSTASFELVWKIAPVEFKNELIVM